MAFPFTYQAPFDTGTLVSFTEVDTESKLSLAHYRTLARHGGHLEVPYRLGAYCPLVDLAPGTAAAYVEEAITMAATDTHWVRFYVFAQGLTLAVNDRFTLFTLQSAGPVDEAVIDLRNAAGVLQILAAETGAAATVRASALSQGVWHAVELALTIDSGVGDDGTLQFYLDGQAVGAPITSLNQAAIEQFRLGAIGLDAGTTAGWLLYDELVIDESERIFPLDGRHTPVRHLTQSAHVCVGPGMVEDVYLLDSGGADAVLTLYDTDRADTSARQIIGPLHNTAGYRWEEPSNSGGTFSRGCYAVLAGTTPQAWITLRHGVCSVGGMRRIAATQAA